VTRAREAAEPVGLTRTQRDVLLVIQELIDLDGRPPSYAEIQHELGLASKGPVAGCVARLVERGWLEKADHHRRSIVIKRRLPLPEEFVFVLPSSRGAA
jgi:SOS-response transcriptional repressor LexA